MEDKQLFWGVVLKPDKRYEQTVEEPFHVSKACIEPSTVEGNKKVTSIYLEKDSDEFIISNLNGHILSDNLDLNFNMGEKICFRTEGGGTVHLTGYLVDDDYEGMSRFEDSMGMSDMEEAEEEEEEDEDEEEAPKLVKKRKLNDSSDSLANGKAKKKKGESALDKLLEESKKMKEVKQAQAMKNVLLKNKNGHDDGDDDDEDEEDSEDMDDDDDEEDEDDEMEDEEEEEEEEEKVSPSPKKSKKQSPTKTPNKKEKNGDVSTPKNGTPHPKKEVVKELSTPKPGQGNDALETPKSKKKNKKNQEENKANGDHKAELKKTPKKTLKGGIIIEDLKIGNGPEATSGKHVGMYYEGKLKSGKVFDKCLQGKPFKFKLGKGEVIKGWDIGINGMKVGGKRRLSVPAQMAYGSEGAPPDIPPNSNLLFEVECKMVN